MGKESALPFGHKKTDSKVGSFKGNPFSAS
jgi:hypothetical protein